MIEEAKVLEPVTSPTVMNMSVASLLCRESRTMQFRADAYRAGIRTVANLITWSERDLFARVPTTPKTQQKIKSALGRLGHTLKQ